MAKNNLQSSRKYFGYVHWSILKEATQDQLTGSDAQDKEWVEGDRWADGPWSSVIFFVHTAPSQPLMDPPTWKLTGLYCSWVFIT